MIGAYYPLAATAMTRSIASAKLLFLTFVYDAIISLTAFIYFAGGSIFIYVTVGAEKASLFSYVCESSSHLAVESF